MNEIFDSVSGALPSVQIDILTAASAVVGVCLILFGIGVLVGVLNRAGSGGFSGGSGDGGKGAR